MIRRDYYQLLGLAQDATATEIRAAFVRLSKRHHPDLASSDDVLPWRLQDVQEAYHCLSDVTARAAHDRALDEDRRQHFDRQRVIQRRLYRFDRSHPRPLPRSYRRTHWRTVLVVVALAGLALRLGYWLFA